MQKTQERFSAYYTPSMALGVGMSNITETRDVMNDEQMQTYTQQVLMHALQNLPMTVHGDFIQAITFQAICLLRGQYSEEFTQGFLDEAKKCGTTIKLEYLVNKKH